MLLVSTVTSTHLTIAWIVSEDVILALMAMAVSPVILTIMIGSLCLLVAAPVKSNAHLLNSEIPPPPTIARWIVAQTAYIALTPTPVPTVKLDFTLMKTHPPPPPQHARLAPLTVILALVTPTVPKTVKMVGPVLHVRTVQLVDGMTQVHAKSATRAVILALLVPPTVPKTVKLVGPVSHVTHVPLVLKLLRKGLHVANV